MDQQPSPTTFEFATCAHDSLWVDYGFYLKNYTTGCGRYFSQGADSYEIGYKQIAFSGAGTSLCSAPFGIIQLKEDSIYFNYKSFDNGYWQPPMNHVFRGIKQ